MSFAPALKLFRNSTFRLALLYMAVFSISVLVLLGFLYWSTARYMVRQNEATIEAEISGLAERYEVSGLPGLRALILERMERKPGSYNLYLLADPDLSPLAGNLERWPDIQAPPEGWVSFNLRSQDEKTNEIHPVRARLFQLKGGYHLLVGRDVHDLENVREQIGASLLWGVAITVLLGLVGGFAMSRRTMHRIETINEICREIMRGDLSRRIPTRNTGDDFDNLIQSLNEMLDKIETLMIGMRQISDNIAHDLRTPLTHLRSRLELLRGSQADAVAGNEILEQTIADADSLLSTFSALLRIGRVEAGSLQAGFHELNLESILLDVVELYEPLAEEKGQLMSLQTSGAGRLRGDRDLLFQALANLLDNAIKYTPEGGRIEIGLQNGARGPQVVVADNGPGIPAEAREQVFQRFFRLEASRSTPGNGLGMSLVAAVVSLHQADIRLENNGPGLRVTLDFSG